MEKYIAGLILEKCQPEKEAAPYVITDIEGLAQAIKKSIDPERPSSAVSLFIVDRHFSDYLHLGLWPVVQDLNTLRTDDMMPDLIELLQLLGRDYLSLCSELRSSTAALVLPFRESIDSNTLALSHKLGPYAGSPIPDSQDPVSRDCLEKILSFLYPAVRAVSGAFAKVDNRVYWKF